MRNIFRAAVVALMALPSLLLQIGPANAALPPNIVMILTDDMRLDDLQYMPFVRHLFRSSGTEFTHAISPAPLCCPARAELMTGQYGQNNGVLHNNGPFGGYQALTDPANTLPAWFQGAGYSTAYLGKFLNGYNGGAIAGLTVNDAVSRGSYQPKGFTVWNDGQPFKPSSHQTDWVTNRTVGLVNEFAGSPFFIWAGYVAPHDMNPGGVWGPPIPPRRYHTFRRDEHRIPKSFDAPSYNEDVSDKPDWIARRNKVSDERMLTYQRGRVLSLYAVDDSVQRIVAGLKAAGVYENTVLVFASDNGHTYGEHRTWTKNMPYQESVRVPLMMVGPGVPVGRVDEIATLVDLPTTLMQMGGVAPGRLQDGTNLFGLPPNRAVLIQAGMGDTPWRWRGVYTKRFTYAEHTTGVRRRELYDRAVDPYELTNRVDRNTYASRRQRYAALLDELRNCQGPGCVVVDR